MIAMTDEDTASEVRKAVATLNEAVNDAGIVRGGKDHAA